MNDSNDDCAVNASIDDDAQRMDTLNSVDCDAGIEAIGEDESPGEQVADTNKSVSGEILETKSNSEETQAGAISETSEKLPEKERSSYKVCYLGPREWNDGYVDPSLPGRPQHLDDDRFHDQADGSMPEHRRRDTRFDAGS
mgnify:CR=1 FL=1